MAFFNMPLYGFQVGWVEAWPKPNMQASVVVGLHFVQRQPTKLKMVRRHIFQRGDVMGYSLLFIALFVVVIVWAFGKKRKSRFEDDAKIPFRDQDKP